VVNSFNPKFPEWNGLKLDLNYTIQICRVKGSSFLLRKIDLIFKITLELMKNKARRNAFNFYSANCTPAKKKNCNLSDVGRFVLFFFMGNPFSLQWTDVLQENIHLTDRILAKCQVCFFFVENRY